MSWSQLKQLAISSCRRRSNDTSAMQFSIDVSILYAQDGSEWADYLQESIQTFMQPRIVNINCVKLGNGTSLLSPISRAIRSSKVLLAIVSEDLLNFVLSVNFFEVGKLMDGERTIAMLCGIRADQLSDSDLAALPASKSWTQMEARSQDKQFAFDLITVVCEQLKKVDETMNCAKPKFRLTPRKVVESNTKVYVLLETAVPDGKKVSVAVDTKEIPCKVQNPYTLQFIMPSQYLTSSKLVSVQVHIDGDCLGNRPIKCESKLSELHGLLQSSTTPFEHLCLTLGLNNIQEVDAALAKSFLQNMPEGFQFLTPMKLIEERRKSESNMPTLLHFSAQYGLKELTQVLIKCPGSLSCCQLLNIKGQSPATVATQAGHSQVASLIDEWVSAQNNIHRMSTLSRNASIFRCEREREPTPANSAPSSQRNSSGSTTMNDQSYENTELISTALRNGQQNEGVNVTDGRLISILGSGSEASGSHEQLPRASSASDSGAHSDASDTEISNTIKNTPKNLNPNLSPVSKTVSSINDYDLLMPRPPPRRPSKLNLQKCMTLNKDSKLEDNNVQEDHVYYMYNGQKTTRRSGCQTLTRDFEYSGNALGMHRISTSMSQLPSSVAQQQRSSVGVYYDIPPMKQSFKSPTSPTNFLPQKAHKSPIEKSPIKTPSLAEALAEYDFPISPTKKTPVRSSSVLRLPEKPVVPVSHSRGHYYDLPRFSYGGSVVVDPHALTVPEVPAPPPPPSASASHS